MSTRRDQQGTTHFAGSAQPVCCVYVDGSLTTLGLALARPLVIHGWNSEEPNRWGVSGYRQYSSSALV